MRTKLFILGSILLIAPFAALAQTSVSGSVTDQQAMTAPSFMACPIFPRSLAIGSRGDDVTALQQFLAVRGFFKVAPTGYYGPITSSAVSQWQLNVGVVSAGNVGLGSFGPLSRAFEQRSCGVPPGSESITGTTTATSSIQQINAPAQVSLVQAGIAEVRNESVYFTLQSVSSNSATIQLTPVGCWNSFPSDTPPQIRCMIAIMPIAPQTFTLGQTYTSPNYSITLTQITNGTATFSVVALSASH